MVFAGSITHRVYDFFYRIKRLEGDPHYVAMGLAIGVFIGITPTIPFHTVLAVFLSFLLKGSKVAAALGVWISNPITIPVFYFLSFKIGTWMLNMPMPRDENFTSLIELFRTGSLLGAAAVCGGIILGIIPGAMTYWLTRRMISILRSKRKRLEGLSPESHRINPKEEV
ncbi:MAG: DUF2062 domain-containing protein [Thermodesulfobacteriota bacterium]